MDHVKELELEILKRIRDSGGKVEEAQFKKMFPNNTNEYQTVFRELSRGGFTITDNYFDVSPTIYILSDQGRLRISQLEKEKADEEKTKEENKKVSAWTIVAGIGGGIAAIPVLIEFFKWLFSQFHR